MFGGKNLGNKFFGKKCWAKNIAEKLLGKKFRGEKFWGKNFWGKKFGEKILGKNFGEITRSYTEDFARRNYFEKSLCMIVNGAIWQSCIQCMIAKGWFPICLNRHPTDWSRTGLDLGSAAARFFSGVETINLRNHPKRAHMKMSRLYDLFSEGKRPFEIPHFWKCETLSGRLPPEIKSYSRETLHGPVLDDLALFIFRPRQKISGGGRGMCPGWRIILCWKEHTVLEGSYCARRIILC